MKRRETAAERDERIVATGKWHLLPSVPDEWNPRIINASYNASDNEVCAAAVRILNRIARARRGR